MLQDGMTVKGFLKGLPGMCIGEIRRLTIPPHLAFGSKGTGRTLLLEIGIDLFYRVNRIGGVMVSGLASSAIECGFKHWSDQTIEYEIGICCFSGLVGSECIRME